MAARADIDPVEIPPLLQHLMLVDVVANGRFRYRLIGTGERRGTGAPRHGRYLDEVLPRPEYEDRLRVSVLARCGISAGSARRAACPIRWSSARA
jgi:hypothetical protein